MSEITKTVTGVAKDLANTPKVTPIGGTDKGPGVSGPVNSNKTLKDARGYYDDNATADTDAHGLTKGPQKMSLGPIGKSMSGDGKGKF
jgi:hypothetical protein